MLKVEGIIGNMTNEHPNKTVNSIILQKKKKLLVL